MRPFDEAAYDGKHVCDGNCAHDGKKEEGATHERAESPSKERAEHRKGGSEYDGKAHPGFAAVAAKIGKKSGIRNPGAVLAAATRNASPAAKRANPRLKKVPGA